VLEVLVVIILEEEVQPEVVAQVKWEEQEHRMHLEKVVEEEVEDIMEVVEVLMMLQEMQEEEVVVDHRM
jgi:hypothetical protein